MGQDFFPKGVNKEIDIHYGSIPQMFQSCVDQFGPLKAFTNMNTSLTFDHLDQLSDEMASFFQNHWNLKKGDRIAIQMPNLLQFPVVMIGALKAGLVIVNTNPLYTAREMEHQFKDSGAKAIVILANFADSLEKVLSKTDIEHVMVTEIGDQLPVPKRWIVNTVVKYVKKMVPKFNLPMAIGFNKAIELGRKNKFEKPMLEAQDIAFLQYTGGTTGVSKGAMLTHKNILSNMEQISEWMKPKLKVGAESVITALPLYHIFSLTVNSLAFMKIGGENILITNPKDIPGFIKTLRTTHFTIFTGVNTLYNALMNHKDFLKIDFSNLKLSVAGGMALQSAVSKRWKEMTGTPVVEGYGLTEASPVVCCNPIDGNDRVGTIGLALPSTEVLILDEEGREVPEGEEGELAVKGPQVMKGYWNQPEETSKVLNDGILKTGDVAVKDGDGFYKIVDRKKDLILVSGFNVYPNEIEDVLSNLEGILEVAAVGIPDDKSGEAIKLFVVKKNSELSEEEIRSYCKDNLVAYKRPKYIEFRDELPKTNIGKILRRALRAS